MFADAPDVTPGNEGHTKKGGFHKSCHCCILFTQSKRLPLPWQRHLTGFSTSSQVNGSIRSLLSFRPDVPESDPHPVNRKERNTVGSLYRSGGRFERENKRSAPGVSFYGTMLDKKKKLLKN